MVEILPGNGIQSTTTADIPAGALAFSIQSGDVASFPSSGNYRCNLHEDALNGPWEIVTVTAGQSTATLVITRASEAFHGVQTAYDWPAGTHVVPVLTKAALAALLAAGGVPDPLTVGTLHVTGASTLDGEFIHTGASTLYGPTEYHLEQDAYYGLLGLWSTNLNTPGSDICVISPAADEPGGVGYQQGYLTFLGFEAGHLGEMDHLDFSGGLAQLYWYKDETNTLGSAQLNIQTSILGGGSHFAQICMDAYTGRTSIGFTFYPQATLHVTGDGLYDGNLHVGGTIGQVTPPVLATGAVHNVDDVIAVLQTIGLVRQS